MHERTTERSQVRQRRIPMSGLGSPRRQGFLEAVHLYRKVPKDLTDATASGGALSLACAALMLYLFVSNIAAYMKMNTTTDVVLDDTGAVHMRLFFNITMVRGFQSLPFSASRSCRTKAIASRADMHCAPRPRNYYSSLTCLPSRSALSSLFSFPRRSGCLANMRASTCTT